MANPSDFRIAPVSTAMLRLRAATGIGKPKASSSGFALAISSCAARRSFREVMTAKAAMQAMATQTTTRVAVITVPENGTEVMREVETFIVFDFFLWFGIK